MKIYAIKNDKNKWFYYNQWVDRLKDARFYTNIATVKSDIRRSITRGSNCNLVSFELKENSQMNTYIAVCAAEPGNFDNHEQKWHDCVRRHDRHIYQIIVTINEVEHTIKISKEEFNKLYATGIIYKVSGEYPVSIYYFKENI